MVPLWLWLQFMACEVWLVLCPGASVVSCFQMLFESLCLPSFLNQLPTSALSLSLLTLGSICGRLLESGVIVHTSLLPGNSRHQKSIAEPGVEPVARCHTELIVRVVGWVTSLSSSNTLFSPALCLLQDNHLATLVQCCPGTKPLVCSNFFKDEFFQINLQESCSLHFLNTYAPCGLKIDNSWTFPISLLCWLNPKIMTHYSSISTAHHQISYQEISIFLSV